MKSYLFTVGKLFTFSAFSTVLVSILNLLITRLIVIENGINVLSLYTQFQNIIVIVVALASGLFSQGIIRFFSSNIDFEQKRELNSAVLVVIVLITGVFSLFGLFYASQISRWLFADQISKIEVYFIAFGLFPYVLNQHALTLLSGVGKIYVYSIFLLLSTFLTLLFVLFGNKFGLSGIIKSGIIAQVSIFILIGFPVVYKYFQRSMNLTYLKVKAYILEVVPYTLLALLSLITVPLLSIFTRMLLSSHHGVSVAAEFDALVKVSNVYLSVIVSFLSIYYLPKFTSLIGLKMQLKNELRNGFVLVLSLTIIILLIFTIFSVNILQIVLSNKFIYLQKHIYLLVVSDFIKVISIFFGVFLLTLERITSYLWTQLVYLIFYLVFALITVPFYSIHGMLLTALVANLAYLVTTVFVVYKFFTKD